MRGLLAPRIYEFDGYRVDTVRHLITLNDEAVSIEPKAFELLLFLLQNRGRVVNKSELIQEIWADRAVSDAAINSAVASLRNAIIENKFGKKILKAAYGRGFILDHDNITVYDVNDQDDFNPSYSNYKNIKPRITVLPFQGVGSDENIAGAVSRSFEEEIFASLCQSHSFTVISRQSARRVFQERERNHDIYKELGVLYLVNGSVSVFGDHFKVHVFLIDIRERSAIWTKDFSGEISNIFEIQDEIVRTVIGTVVPEVYLSEAERRKIRSPSSWDVYDKILLSLPLCWKLERQATEEALVLLGEAIQSEPRNGLAIALKAWCLAQKKIYSWDSEGPVARKDVLDLSTDALRLDGSNPHVLTVYSTATTLVGELTEARRSIEKALEIDPNLAWGWNRMGWVDGYDCHPQKSIESFETSLMLSPLDPMRFNCFFGIGQAHFILEDFDSSLHWLDRAVFERPDAIFVHRLRSAVAFYSGDNDEAKKSAKTLRDTDPNFDPKAIGALVPFSRKDIRGRLIDGMIGAGL